MTHPHRDLIIALLDDPTLEVERVDPINLNRSIPVRLVDIAADTNGLSTYRIKEKPKTDVVLYFSKEYLRKQGREYFDAEDVLRLTFTADGVLKNAEVIK